MTVGSSSRLEIRQDVGLALGDLIILEATDNGSTTSFSDTTNIWQSYHDGCLIYFLDGLNQDAMRRVTATSPTNGTISWSTPLDVDTSFGDRAELWNYRGSGLNPKLVNQHIDMVHRRARKMVNIPMATEFTSDSTGSYEIPEEYEYISQVQYLNRDSDWIAIPRARRFNGPGYTVDPVTGSIVLGGFWTNSMDGETLRILGYGQETPLITDDDETALDSEWIADEVCSSLLLAHGMRLGQESGWTPQRLAKFARDSEMKRPALASRYESTLDRVR